MTRSADFQAACPHCGRVVSWHQTSAQLSGNSGGYTIECSCQPTVDLSSAARSFAMVLRGRRA